MEPQQHEDMMNAQFELQMVMESLRQILIGVLVMFMCQERSSKCQLPTTPPSRAIVTVLRLLIKIVQQLQTRVRILPTLHKPTPARSHDCQEPANTPRPTSLQPLREILSKLQQLSNRLQQLVILGRRPPPSPLANMLQLLTIARRQQTLPRLPSAPYELVLVPSHDCPEPAQTPRPASHDTPAPDASEPDAPELIDMGRVDPSI